MRKKERWHEKGVFLIYRYVAGVLFMNLFFFFWIYLGKHYYGLGLLLGWIPAFIAGFLIALAWPFLLAAIYVIAHFRFWP